MICGESKISLRLQPVGGQVAARVRPTGGTSRGRRNIMILVHGFKVDTLSANNSYAKFQSLLAPLSNRIPGNIAHLSKLYWPGDADWGIVKFACYPKSIRAARRSARRLARYLASLSGPGGQPIEVNLIGHSLGCRLILEMLSVYNNNDPHIHNDKDDNLRVKLRTPHFRLVSVMAAAVPSSLVKPNERLEQAARLARKRLVLYSSKDMVLKGAFPAGQSVAKLFGIEDKAHVSALGSKGRPETFGDIRISMTGNGHGDYWDDPRAAREVARALGAALPYETQERERQTHMLPVPEKKAKRIPPMRKPLSRH